MAVLHVQLALSCNPIKSKWGVVERIETKFKNLERGNLRCKLGAHMEPSFGPTGRAGGVRKIYMLTLESWCIPVMGWGALMFKNGAYIVIRYKVYENNSTQELG